MNIRIVNSDADCLSASRIYALSWRAGYRGILSDGFLDDIPLDRWAPFFRENLTTGRYAVAILSAEGRDVAAGGYGRSRDYDDPSWGEVTSIYALPEI